MSLVNPKSFVAGLLMLSYMVKSLIAALAQVHASAFHKFTLVFSTMLAALLIWHGFKGQKAVPRDELRISVTMGIASLLCGLVLIFRPRVQDQLAAILAGALYFFAAVYYFRLALQERQSLATCSCRGLLESNHGSSCLRVSMTGAG